MIPQLFNLSQPITLKEIQRFQKLKIVSLLTLTALIMAIHYLWPGHAFSTLFVFLIFFAIIYSSYRSNHTAYCPELKKYFLDWNHILGERDDIAALNSHHLCDEMVKISEDFPEVQHYVREVNQQGRKLYYAELVFLINHARAQQSQARKNQFCQQLYG